ncbi:MAG: DNA polymerase I [Actinomycetota bacterium]|nr:DNA polymerase I [Actinomycetota bacterium]
MDQKKKVAVTSGQHLEQLGSEIEDKLYMLGVETEAPVLLLYGGTDKVYLLEGRHLANKGVRDSLSTVMNSGIGICGFDFKVIFKMFMGEDFSFSGKVIDLKILYLLLNQHLPDVSLEQLISSLCGLDLKQGPARGQMQLESGSDQDEALESGVVSIGLLSRMEDQISEQIDREGLDKVYRDIEEPLIRVLADMEFKGVHVDKRYLNELIVEYGKNIAELEQEIFDLCGEKFNINSTQQLASILYDKLNLPATKKTKTGYSTDASALYAIYDQSPVIAKILDYREQTKLKNTYIDVLPRLIDSEDGRIHATYNQMGTTTGRISSNDPNLQNIPIRTSLGRQIRKAFVPGTGYDLILAADYSQIELRILAHLAEDDSLIEAFNQGQDIHSRTASEIFGVDYHQVDDSMRRKAKAINFGIIYGMTKYGLMNRLKITEQEAEDYINTYFARYPRVKEYLDQLIKTAYSCGYATTIFGRKRKIVELGSSNGRLRSVGERLAVNTPIQGSAADIMKLATVNVYRNIGKQNLDCNIILNVHDELVLELKKGDALEVEKLVKESMEGCVSLKVKLKVDIKTGPNWYI